MPDLTAIAGLATTGFGRSHLTLADAVALRAHAGLAIGIRRSGATTPVSRRWRPCPPPASLRAPAPVRPRSARSPAPPTRSASRMAMARQARRRSRCPPCWQFRARLSCRGSPPITRGSISTRDADLRWQSSQRPARQSTPAFLRSTGTWPAFRAATWSCSAATIPASTAPSGSATRDGTTEAIRASLDGARFAPNGSGSYHLGGASARWGTIYGTSLDISGTVSIGGSQVRRRAADRLDGAVRHRRAERLRHGDRDHRGAGAAGQGADRRPHSARPDRQLTMLGRDDREPCTWRGGPARLADRANAGRGPAAFGTTRRCARPN